MRKKGSERRQANKGIFLRAYNNTCMFVTIKTFYIFNENKI